MITEYSSNNLEISDILDFEGIQYLKIKFIGQKLKNKSYHLTVKEIWDGKIISDTTLMNSRSLPYEWMQKISDTTLNMKVISKLTINNKLKMTFKFPGFSFNKEFEAYQTKDKYSLRNVAEESNLEIGYNKKFYLLAYILPYDSKDGHKRYCDVGTSGKDIENWGSKFGIKHYLLFEMKLE